MRAFKLLNPILMLCIMFSIAVHAQYQIPSQERVQELLNQIENCKNQIDKTEKNIATMEAQAASYTLAQYNNGKALLERIKFCLNMSRAELANLKKEYPGWFNDPDAIINLGKGIEIKPHDLQKKLNEIERKIKKVIDRMEALEKPKN